MSYSSFYLALPDSIKNLVKRIVQEIKPDEVVLFGSRARGDHRESSDFDIAVRFSSNLAGAWSKLQLALEEESITLYSVDLVDFNQLSDSYQKHIRSEGKMLYARSLILF